MTQEFGYVTATHLTYGCPTSTTSPIVNGDFETGNTDGWDVTESRVSVVEGAAHSGNYGLLIFSTGAGLEQWRKDIGEAYQPLSLSWCDFESMDIWYKVPYFNAPNESTHLLIRIYYVGVPE